MASKSTFAAGLNEPSSLAFNSAGDLFEADLGSGKIFEFTPDGTQSTFATGLNHPTALAFDSLGNLFEADFASGNINEFTPDGVESTFASGLPAPSGLAFSNETLPVPEPSTAGLLTIAAAVLAFRPRHCSGRSSPSATTPR